MKNVGVLGDGLDAYCRCEWTLVGTYLVSLRFDPFTSAISDMYTISVVAHCRGTHDSRRHPAASQPVLRSLASVSSLNASPWAPATRPSELMGTQTFYHDWELFGAERRALNG